MYAHSGLWPPQFKKENQIVPLKILLWYIDFVVN